MTHTKIYNGDGKLQKAGGIIVREINGIKEVLLIRSEKRGWSFPKGHLEENEAFEEGAIRECHEETGLELEIVKTLPDLEYQNSETGDFITVKFYLMKVVGGELIKENNNDELRWVTISVAEKILEYQNLKKYLKNLRLADSL